MSRYNNDNGCVLIYTYIGLIIVSIVMAFKGQFIPIVIIITIILILWFENIYVKHKNERKKLAETVEGRNEIESNNSKLFVVIIIIILGVIISMVFQSNKRQYLENNKNEQIEYIPSNIQSENIIDTTQTSTLKKETVWLNENLQNCNFKLPDNFILQEWSNENMKFYVDLNSNLSFNFLFGSIPDDAEYKSLDEISQNITSFANSVNENNKLNFDDFKLIDYKIEKLGNLKAIKIEQTSTKVSVKDIEMLVTNYNLISGSTYYNITFAYPKDSLKFKNDFDKIKNSLEFKIMQNNNENSEVSQNIELGNYKVIVNIDEKVYFYNKPDELYKRKGYLTNGDQIYVEEIDNNFGYVNFTNPRGLNSKGWIKMKFLEKN